MITPRFPAGPLLREVHELQEPLIKPETALRLAGAKVVVADYELLQADFPALATPSLLREFPELAAMDPAAQGREIRAHIDAWLVRHAGVVASRQTLENPANTAISTTGERVKVHRPPRYGRAFVAPVPGGLLDVKGVGVGPDATPSTRLHQSGLMFLGEALADLTFQRVIERALRHCESSFWTLPVYAVLSLGFHAITGDGQRLPAGAQVRRAHRRPLFGADLHPLGSIEQRVKLEIELVLRHYGLSSCTSATTITREQDGDRFRFLYGGLPVDIFTVAEMVAMHEFIGPRYSRFEGLNIQLIREVGNGPVRAQIVDFGHFEAHERFEHPLVSLVLDRVLRWGGALYPDDPHYVQPRPSLALPRAQWGATSDAEAGRPPLPGVIRPSNVDRLAFALAARFVAGDITGAELDRALRAPVEEASAHWPLAAGS
jgi:hypothetical protein